MTYVLTDGATTVVAYPYNIGQLRRDNPTISFPANPTNAQLAGYNMFPVTATDPPTYDSLSEDLNELTPILAEGGAGWTQVWVVTSISPEDAAVRYADAAASTDAEANGRLVSAEQYYIDAMIAGHGFSADMSAYIDALSNPTTLPGYPLVTAWPELPATALDPTNPDLPIDVYTRAQTDAAIGTAVGDESVDLVASFEDTLMAS